jgi:hypothetical protein
MPEGKPRQLIFRIATIAPLVALIAAVPHIEAQQVFGSVYGTITDAKAGAVPNAKVTIVDEEKGTQSEVDTNTDGNFVKDRLIPGTYMLTVQAPGFAKSVVKDVRVNVDTAARVDVKLQIGQVSESIEVAAVAPLLQTDRADIATTFTSKQLVDLPRLDRNFQSFLLLSPGTSRLGWNHASSENPQGSIQIQVNGQHFGSTGFQLDGTDNQDPILGIIVINPAIDSVTETKVAGQNYDAEFGYVGAGMMNTSTKSGTNTIHGSAFEYLRNNSPGFTTFARNPFGGEDAKDGGVPPVKWNQFGGSIGGPVIKNKLFFFGDAQLSRRRTGSSVKTTVPSLAARNGDLSAYLTGGRNQVYDPSTGDPATGVGRTPFANNVIPANRLSPQALNLIKLLPAPNNIDPNVDPSLRGLVNNYVSSGSEQFDSNQWDTRWDYFINEKSSLFGRYSDAEFNKFAPGAFGAAIGGPSLNNITFAGLSDVGNRSLALGYTRTISPTLIADFRFGYMRYRVNVLPSGLGTSPAKDAGIPGLNLDNYFTSGLPYFNVSGDGGFQMGYALGVNSCNCPLAQKEQQYQFVGNVTKMIGNHSIKLGADLRRASNLRVPSDSHRAGELSFSNSYTGLVDANGATSQGLGLGTFLLGATTGFSRYVSPVLDASESQKRFYWYAQDTWRLTQKLQVNYGVRWEMVFPEKVNAPGNGGQLDLSTGRINVFGVGGVSDHGIQNMNWRNIAPRIGVTYQVTPTMVVRAGYGWSYSVGVFGTLFGHNVTQNLPVLAYQQLNPSTNFASVFTLAQGPPSPTFPKPDSNGTFPLPDGVAGKARPGTVVMPRVMNYNITVQRQLVKDLSVQVAYVGNTGRHVFNGDGPNINVNQAAFVPGVASSNLRKPFYAKYGWSQGIDYYCNCATNQYDSLQIQVERRFRSVFQLNANYTYQRVIDDSGDSFTFLYNRPLGRGNKDWFPHNQFVLSGTLEIPFGKGRRFGANMPRPAEYALGGWAISGITTYYSGRPFTPSIGTYPASAIRPNAGPADRPDQGSGDPFTNAKGGREQFFVGGLGSAFLIPANDTFGNFPRNGLFGPRFINQDLSLAKSFNLTERYRLSLRAETFNTFNHTNLGDPNSDVTSPDAGKITGIAPSYQMRRVQFGFRLDW